MGIHPYIMSHVMIEEHRQNVATRLPDPDWPAPVPAGHVSRPGAIRLRIGAFLRALANRLDPPGMPEVRMLVLSGPVRSTGCCREEMCR